MFGTLRFVSSCRLFGLYLVLNTRNSWQVVGLDSSLGTAAAVRAVESSAARSAGGSVHAQCS